MKPSAHTKQRQAHRVPLSAAAVQLLTELLAQAKAAAAAAAQTAVNPHVFPGHDGKPITDIKRTWLLCRAAGLTERMEKRAPDASVVKTAKGEPVNRAHSRSAAHLRQHSGVERVVAADHRRLARAHAAR